MAAEKGRHIVWEYLFPPLDSKLTTSIDRQSMRSICNVSLAASIFETISLLVFMTMGGWDLEGERLTIFYSVGFCAVFSLFLFLASRTMMRNKELPHLTSLTFKVSFFAIYTVWAIYSDMRHYAAGEQMLTFFIIQLLAACFIWFEPLISIILVFAAYAGLYAAAYVVRQAEGIDIFNLILLAILTAFGMSIQFHTQVYLARKEERLEEISHRDALTGLRNRLALEEDAKRIIGAKVMAYMIDIDYFKEANDRFGHAMGDEILKETANILPDLYPDSLCYRYGGDEFLVLSNGDLSGNYVGEGYEFNKQNLNEAGSVSLSIGCAKGEPRTYDEVFVLIKQADAALYEVKARTHSPERGGHDRRRRR